jgi:hypothetical protein
MEPFARTIDAAGKYFAPSTLNRADWHAERRDAQTIGDTVPLPPAC